MPNLVDITYNQTGQSTVENDMGMRDMQSRAYELRESKHLLLKSPPASGKSRALMFIALDKLANQGIKKVIVAVPERSIGGSFASTDLKSFGFFEDWVVKDEYNLCTPGGEKSKVKTFHNFLNSTERILICTHHTLRFAFDEIESESSFDNILLAIDEFHHVSADISNKLGELLRPIMNHSTAHILAMTGSYFRGDSIPILLAEDEDKFTKMSYNYYEQLNGYKYLKSLGIGYHFYQGKYTEAISEVLDTNKKTIIHIPNVNQGESTKDKHNEVDFILDVIGNVLNQDAATGVINVKREDGKILKVADLVEDSPVERIKIVEYLRKVEHVDDIDIIIALGMAKEGFDWPYCEHALTVGYRGSLTEIVQIIGRATRDSENKSHSQFTNLIAQPDADDDEIKIAVNDMLKAITASLLMEQVLAPNFKFKSKFPSDGTNQDGTVVIKGFKKPSTEKVKKIIESDLDDLKAKILQDSTIIKALPGDIDAEVMNKALIPKIIRTTYPNLTDEELEEVRQYVVVDTNIKKSEIKEVGDKRFLRMADKFIDMDEIHIDMIDRINPFQKAFEVMSKSVNRSLLKVLQETIQATKIKITFEEAQILWPKIKEFYEVNGRAPNIESSNAQERRMAECVLYLKEEKRRNAKKE